jgi:hypothetical protein
MLYYTTDQSQLEHINLANNQVSHNTKLNQGKKSGNQIHQLAYQKYSGTAPSGAMGRRNHSLQKNNSVQGSVGNEENGYPFPDFNKIMTNETKELSDAHEKTLKEEIWEEIFEKFMEEILGVFNQNVQDALKMFQDTKNKEHVMTQK